MLDVDLRGGPTAGLKLAWFSTTQLSSEPGLSDPVDPSKLQALQSGVTTPSVCFSVSSGAGKQLVLGWDCPLCGSFGITIVRLSVNHPGRELLFPRNVRIQQKDTPRSRGSVARRSR